MTSGVTNKRRPVISTVSVKVIFPRITEIKENENASMVKERLIMALEVLQQSKYDMLDPIVEDLYTKCIRIDNKEKQLLVNRFQRVITKFVDTMKQVDTDFRNIYNRIGYTGSFYEGLRIGEATEYDLNLILKPKFQMKIVKRGCPAGFVAIEINPSEKPLTTKPFKNWVRDVYLDPDRVKSWLQGVVMKTFEKCSRDGWLFEDCEIHIGRHSGPAWTLSVTSNEYPQKSIDIDLVPVLEFPSTKWPNIPRKSKRIVHDSYDETWFAVPKPPKVYPGNCKCAWRLSFPKQETAAINSLQFLKYTLKLLKRVRDKLGFSPIASYYIKTLFLWEVQNQDNDIWKRNRRGRLFVYMLIRLKEALGMQRIPFFWEEECNLVGHISEQFLYNSYGRITHFLVYIDKCINRNDLEGLEVFIKINLYNTEETQEEEIAQSQSSCTIL